MGGHFFLQRILLTQSNHQRGIKYAPMLLGEIDLPLLEKMEKEPEKKEERKECHRHGASFDHDGSM